MIEYKRYFVTLVTGGTKQVDWVTASSTDNHGVLTLYGKASQKIGGPTDAKLIKFSLHNVMYWTWEDM